MVRTCSLAVAAALLAAAPAARAADVKLPDDAKAALEKADQIELLSIDPSKGDDKPNNAFHGYKVLGKTTVKKDDAKTLSAAVLKGVADSDGTVAKCFEPRHGVRVVVDDKAYDFVICFQCSQIEVFAGDKKLGVTPTAKTAEPALDKLLKDAGVGLAPKPEK
jgi:hypothetical protein